MKSYPYVIIGGGLVAGYAAQTFVEQGLQREELCILSAESHLPYERPPLSKDFLRGERAFAEILINPPTFYADHGIDVRLASPVVRVDFSERRLDLTDDTILYDKLLIATGARPRRLHLPGAELAGIYYLRQVEDATLIHQAAAGATRAVVIGGGFIGMEVAAVLQQMKVATTLLFPAPHLCEHLFTTRMATFFHSYYRQRGVEVLPQERATGFVSDDGHVTHVSLASGRDLATDLVVVGIGITPNIELFTESALQLDSGIVVNRFLETSLPHVYAAGDVACYRDLLYNRLRRVDHWDNAVTQGQQAVRNMMGAHEEYLHVPYLFSDFFDLSYELWGDPENAERVIYRGDVENGRFSTWWLSPAGRLLAAFILNRAEEERQLAQQWIQSGVQLNIDTLRDQSCPLQSADPNLPASPLRPE